MRDSKREEKISNRDKAKEKKKKGKSKRGGGSWRKVSPAPKKDKTFQKEEPTAFIAGRSNNDLKMATGPDASPSAQASKSQETAPVAKSSLAEAPSPADNSAKAVAPQTSTSSSSDEDDFEVGLKGQDQNIYDGGSIFYASDNDPYIYSDDSESFSDAYFRPQKDDFPAVIYPGSTNSLTRLADEAAGRRVTVTGTEEEPLTPFTSSPFSNQFRQNAPQYGSVQNRQFSDRSSSPFKISGSIKEDSPVDEEQQKLMNYDSSRGMQYYNIPSNMPADEADAQYLKEAKKERRRLRRQQRAAARQRQIMMIQNQQKREQAIRERTVTEVKGRPQDERKCRDPIFAYLFLAQLLIVLISATRSGTLVLFSKQAATWGKLQRTAVTGTTISSSGTTTDTSTSTKIPSATSSSSSSSSSIPKTLSSSSSSSSSGGSHRRRRLRQEDTYQKNSTIRRPSSPMLDSSITILKNATLQDVLITDNDTEKLLTDDSIVSDQDSSSTSGTSHKHNSKNKTSTSKKQAPAENQSSIPIWHPTSFTIDYRNVIALVGISGFYACILSYLSFGFMLIMSRALIQVTLVFSVLLALAWGMLGLTIDPYGIISIMGFVALLLTLGYTIYNWQRVPFASTNLHTALCAMRCTGDIALLGMVAVLVAFGWCVIWCMAFIGAVDMYDPGQCTNEQTCVFSVPLVRVCMYSFFTASFYWTNSVIKNVLRVTVASTIGTWWYYPQEISPLCSAAVFQPLVRSLTKSLGSICLGSLVSQPAQAVFILGQCLGYVFRSECCRRSPIQGRESVANGNKKQDALSAATTGDDIEKNTVPETPPASSENSPMQVSPTAKRGNQVFGRRIRCFNRWSYTYVGMYGYNFCEGGEKAIHLFEAREWMEVVRDNLIQNVLLMASIVIGGSTGTFAVMAEEVDGFDFTTFHKPITTAFFIGSVLGFVLSNVLLLGVVGSAVNTILVCFAAGPFEFDRNHPRLSREMREVWSQQVWEPSV